MISRKRCKHEHRVDKTADEDSFLLQHYNLDGTGWGSPFLLVPEAINVDDVTLKLLTGADEDYFYISGASPLGILFNNFKKSSAEENAWSELQKAALVARVAKNIWCRTPSLPKNRYVWLPASTKT